MLLVASRWQQPSPPSLPHYLSLFKISFFLKNWTCTCTLSSPRAHNCLSIGGDVPQMLDNIPARRWFSAADCPQLQQRAAALNHSRSIGKRGRPPWEPLALVLHLHLYQKESSSCLLSQVFRRRRSFPFNILCTFGLDPPLSPNDKICKRTFKTKGQHKRGTPKDQRKRHSCRWINNWLCPNHTHLWQG